LKKKAEEREKRKKEEGREEKCISVPHRPLPTY
jgi:hypothetical protein